MKRAILILVLVLGAAPPARAAPCNTPDLLYTLPREGATAVPTDATLLAAYTTATEYAGEEVLLIPAVGDPRPVPAAFDRVEKLLTIKPPEGLVPGATYSVRWPSLRGVDTASPGVGREVRFTAGAGPDAEAPRFDGVGAVSWELERQRSSCSDEIEERFLFDVELGGAADDGGAESLSLVVFQSVAGAAPVQVLRRPIPPGVVQVGVPASTAVGKVCFSAVVQDLTGKASSTQRESCVETVAPPFFRGCEFGGEGGGGLALAALAWVIAWRRRRC